MDESRSCLVVGLTADEDRFRRIFGELKDSVSLAADADRGQELTDSQSFDLIVVEFPVPGRDTAELLKAFRWSGSKSREAVVVLVTTPDLLEDAEDLHDLGVSRILNRQAKDAVLKIALHEVTRSEERLPIKAFVRIPGSDLGMPGTIMAQTLNVSTTGMLVRMTKEALVGSRFTFSLQIPHLAQPIRGAAEVVRITQGPGDRVTGFAAAFTEFERGDERILRDFVANLPPAKAGTPGH